MANNGSTENNIWPMPKFRFDTLREAQKAGGPIGEAYMLQEGDSLKSLSASRYGDERYYGRIAHYNGLNKFRNIKGGQQFIFPPIMQPTD